MSRKLAIRRVGAILPAFSLLALLLFCIAIVWLSTAGLPECVLRKVEKAAAEQGIALKLGALKLEPSRGLALCAEDIRIYAEPGNETPLAAVKAVSVGINATRLLTGALKLDSLHLRGGWIHLPVNDADGEQLKAQDIEVSARFGRGDGVRLTSGSLKLQGIPIRVQGSFSLSDFQGSESAEPLGVAALLQEHEETINSIYRQIENQRWTPEELPSLDLQIRLRRQLYLQAKAHIPRYDYGAFHFREAVADVVHEQGRIVINSLKFKTIDPKSHVSLQAGYDMRDRTLSFSLESTAALLHMAKAMSNGELQRWLNKFHHEDDESPHIILKGDVGFEPDFSLRQASVVGDLLQNNLHIGNTLVKQLDLSFYYNNGDFNISRLHFLFPEGELNASASIRKGKGKADVQADVPVTGTIALINEFTESPLALPAGLQLKGNLKLKAQAELTAPLFEPGQTDWQDFVPHFENLSMHISIEKAAFLQQKFRQPCLELMLQDLEQDQDMVPCAAGQCKLHFTAKEAGFQYAGSQLLIHSPDIGLDLSQISYTMDSDILSLGSAAFSSSWDDACRHDSRLQGFSMLARLEKAELNRGRPFIQKANAEARAEKMEIAGSSADSVFLEISNASNIAPLDPWRNLLETIQIKLDSAMLRHGSQNLGKASLLCEATGNSLGQLELRISSGEAAAAGEHEEEAGQEIARLKATADWTHESLLSIHDLSFTASPAAFSGILEQAGAVTDAFLLPEELALHGDAVLNTSTGTLKEASVSASIPKLVRTPQTVKAFRGQQIPISIQTDAHFTPEANGGISYQAAFTIRHDTGEFSGEAQGGSNGRIKLTGNSSLGLETIDKLIDMEDAHEIMRDFRSMPESQTRVNDIDVSIDYSNGISVDSYCLAELRQMDYLLGAIETDQEGNEKLRTDLGKNPYTSINRCACSVTAKVRKHMMQGGKELPRESVITIGNADILYNNSPWFARQDFSALNQTKGMRPEEKFQETSVHADAIIIDIENSFVELRNVKGDVYPAYSFGMFYPDLELFMDDVLLPAPAQVEALSCVFPIYSDCKRPMSGTIRIESPSLSGFRFLGTTIPLTSFSGFIYLTDDYILLDRMNAQCWGGVLNAAVKIGITGKSSSFDGFASAENMDLKKIAAAYDSKQKYALFNANVRFRSPSPELEDLQAHGEIVIANGDLLSLGLFKPIGDLISDIPGHLTDLENKALHARKQQPGLVSRLATRAFKSTGRTISRVGSSIDWTSQNVPGLNHILAYDLQDAYARFTIANGHLTSDALKAKGYNLSARAHLDINLDTLELRGNLWPSISSLPTVLLSPLTFLSDFMIDIIIYGKADDINWKFGLDKRLQNAPASATDKPGDPLYKPTGPKR